ncbi:MAG: serine/threonine protein kinase [Planctomycetes bacterium]|nr:serine/threonine protein kinase [Planctomycetota bacterium]
MSPHDPKVPKSSETWANTNPKPQPATVVDTQRTRVDTDSEVNPRVEPPPIAEFPVELGPDWPAVTIAQSPREAGRAAELSHTLTAPRPLPTIPNYEVIGELGRGGMGVVYKARHIKLNRPTAIKMLLGGQYADTIAHVRFLIEAEVVAQIQHPHAVQVFEFGQHDGQPFFAMEFVDGGTLAGKLHLEARFTPRNAAMMVGKLADGIAAAHAKGIVHRDLKPANVLLDPHGEPKVTDFGLAKVGSSDMTDSGAIMGTPSYMSPEQAAGRTKEVGTPTDVYALGVILYELMSGRAPFRGDSVMETIQQVLTREPARPRTVVPSIPRDLETICLKCMEKDPKARYSTVPELASDLRAYLDGRPIAARPVSNLERSWKWTKRNPGRATALAATLLVLSGAGIAANEVQNQKVLDRIGAEQQRAADGVAAEVKRAADLKAADDVAKQRQRETRAEALVRSLGTANTSDVPRVIEDLFLRSASRNDSGHQSDHDSYSGFRPVRTLTPAGRAPKKERGGLNLLVSRLLGM